MSYASAGKFWWNFAFAFCLGTRLAGWAVGSDSGRRQYEKTEGNMRKAEEEMIVDGRLAAVTVCREGSGRRISRMTRMDFDSQSRYP
jgi:hypothetical protein